MFLYLRIPKTHWLFARMSYSHEKLLVWNASIWVQWPCNRILSGVSILMSPRTLLGTFNSAPVLSSGVNVKTSDDTDSFDLFVEKSTKAIEGQEKKKKQKAWSPLRWFHVFFWLPELYIQNLSNCCRHKYDATISRFFKILFSAMTLTPSTFLWKSPRKR